MNNILRYYACSLLLFILYYLDPTCGFSSSPSNLLQQTKNLKSPPTPLSTRLKPLEMLPEAADAASLIIDPTMAGYKMQAFESYGTVTALAINAALFLYTTYDLTEDGPNAKLYRSIFIAANALCIISGAFTVLLFTLLVIYSQSALGMGNEAGFVVFWKETNNFAPLGFQSFLACSGSFVVAFLLSLKQKIADDDTVGNIILALSTVLVLAGAFQIESVLSLATNVIFTPEFMDNNS
eukprot:CAMPEP_0113609408 /NCGR_PEP_ID=MMETSP0017_2-20120614/4474_1 /TAXON_ID=2856 /ORGANISM="Cylindrotheca closterium" /LENGTH=237 /DNA_ID=CAMNT_0000518221 /DNA_START=72 /DNA_END=782 /DNA_ORIENTATION=- /assembly_acc=CAM_ASM_000147